MSELASRGISAAKWGVALSVARMLAQIGTQALLARLLGPEFYGLFGMALVVILLTTYFSEIGIGIFILQRQHLTEDDLRFSITWQLLLGTLGAITLFAASPSIAAALNDSRVEPVMQWLALSCVLSAAAYPSTHLLYRDLRFRAIGLIDLAGYLLGYVLVGIPLALAGAGVMSLVASFLTHAFVRFAATTVIRRHSWQPLFTHPEAREILRVGRSVWLTLVVTWLITSIDRIIIARLMGAKPVGLYNAAYNLVNTAISSTNTLSTTFLSSGARIRDDRERLGRAFLQIFAGVWIICAPLFVLAAMLSETIVAIIYGSKWVGASDVLRALLVAAPAWLSFALSTPLLWNTGRGYLEPLFQLPLLAVYVLALILSADFGLETVAWVVAGMLMLRAFVISLVACRVVALSPLRLLPEVARGGALCLVVVLGAELGDALGTISGSSLAATALTGILPLTAIALLLVRFPSILGEQARTMVLRIAPRLKISGTNT